MISINLLKKWKFNHTKLWWVNRMENEYLSNRDRYNNIVRNLGLQDEEKISAALKAKGMYSSSQTYPLSSLLFELTSVCPCKCKHCYNRSGENSVCNKELTLEQWIQFANYLVRNGGVFECLVSGGEPLVLGEKLFDFMDIFHNDGTIFTFETNGYLMTQDIARKLSKYLYHWLQISIDGVNSKYHDKFRQLQGSWEKAVHSAEMVSSIGIPLKIAHIVTPYNIDDIDEMCRLAYSLGASSIIIGEVCLSGRVAFNRDLLLSENERAKMIESVMNNRDLFKGKMIVKGSNSIKGGLENHSKHPRSGAVIRPNGDIRIDGMAPFVIGNILQEDFTKVWEEKIDRCWEDSRVKKFIASFDEDDRNRICINYFDKDIYL